MHASPCRTPAILLAALSLSASAFAHVSLPPGGATAGSTYDAAFRVGHACKDAKATTGITVRIPEGFSVLKAEPRPGWTLATSPGSVSWRADSAQAAVPGAERADFIVRGALTAKPGTLWFKVLQSCDVGQADWAAVAATANDKPEFPAARLDVLPPGVAAVEVRDAWIRMAVRGQSGTGAFMKLAAPAGARLVGASTPVAGIAEVHEMKMEGDVMRMRAVPEGLELPARQAVELKPGGYHLMLMDLKQALVVGETVPLTLEFVDREGRKSVARLQVPVQAAPASGDDGDMAAHRH
jgi:periplasmic copper chaperone A